MRISKGEQLDIVAVVGRYVNLKKHGTVYVGLCPFHQEHTPSFTVYPNTNSWYCFGCKKSGDARQFWKGDMGMIIPSSTKKVPISRPFSFEIVEYWHRQLRSHRVYFQNRGFSDATIDREMWGWATEYNAYVIPVWAGRPRESDVMSVRLRSAGGNGPRYFGVEGYNSPRLYNSWVLTQGEMCCIVFGELDAQSLVEMGMAGVSPTAGVNSFQKEWASMFSGYQEVLVVPDNTPQEMQAVAPIPSYFPNARIVTLPNDVKDFNEYLLKYRTIDKFLECVHELNARQEERWRQRWASASPAFA